ncbi:hypothetical protein OEZ85_014198 [Tetradesmus obliquus]|uniref:tRNA (guanine(9)-N(1))-methyltransferase n=1 Tax=Tetradesmus obliquus TaxID=3088 RepID=A0ABY8U7I9_TETOB|nr:hypothetical protein OEZ85_014198 [Tetradesmus obliquus]
MEQPADNQTTPADEPSAPAAMSKRQMKRLQKMERQEENKKAKKAAEKEQKQKALEQKRADIGKMLEGMTEEEREQWHQQQKDKKQKVLAGRQATKAHNQQALSAPQKVVIDLDFLGMMSPSEVKSLLQQLSYSYSAAVSGQQQLHLHLLGATGDLDAALLKQLPGHVNWAATKSEKNFKEFFQERLQDLVYLTADSPDELSELDSSKVYIIGGIVDRNRHKGICYQRAQEAGIATAKLPIAQHIKLQTSAVITVNQVVDILVRVQGSNDWKAALEHVLPGRKRADAAAPAAAGAAAGAAAEAAAPPSSGEEPTAAAAGAAAEAGAEAAAAYIMEAGKEAVADTSVAAST